MNSDKRFFLAVAFAFLILTLYPVYLRWINPRNNSSEGTSQKENLDFKQAISKQQNSSASPQTELTREIPKENFYKFENQHLKATFSNRGATVTELWVKNWGRVREEPSVALIENAEGQAIHASGFLTNLLNQGTDFQTLLFTLETLDVQTGEVKFSAEIPEHWRMVKTFRFNSKKPVFEIELSVQNLSASTQTTTIGITCALSENPKNVYEQRAAKMYVEEFGKLESAPFGQIRKHPHVFEGKLSWQALAKRYFAVFLRPDVPATLSKVWVEPGRPYELQSQLQFSAEEIAPGNSATRRIEVYAGPQYHSNLKAAGHGFERILSDGFFGTFKLWLLAALLWTYKLVGNYGWAIILVTCALKLAFTPFTHMSFQSMKKMQALQPKLKALQDQHKNDQTKLSQEMMALYKRHKVNPMGGCLPMLLQIPVFISFYQVLIQSVELKGAPFILWIKDLSEPDRLFSLPLTLPLIGSAINLLPVLMLGSMIWQQRLTPQTGTPEQRQVMMIMPIVFGFVFYNLPSGLVLYWFVSNLLSIVHQTIIKGKPSPELEA